MTNPSQQTSLSGRLENPILKNQGLMPQPLTKGLQLMMKMGYIPGQGLGRNNEGRRDPIPIIDKKNRHGLGYDPSHDFHTHKRSSLTLNGQFVLQNETEPYHEFPEPWYDFTSQKILPGLEIFFAEARDEDVVEKWFYEKPKQKEYIDWIEYLKHGVLRNLFSTKFGDIEDIDPLSLIVPVEGDVQLQMKTEKTQNQPYLKDPSLNLILKNK